MNRRRFDPFNMYLAGASIVISIIALHRSNKKDIIGDLLAERLQTIELLRQCRNETSELYLTIETLHSDAIITKDSLQTCLAEIIELSSHV